MRGGRHREEGEREGRERWSRGEGRENERGRRESGKAMYTSQDNRSVVSDEIRALYSTVH